MNKKLLQTILLLSIIISGSKSFANFILAGGNITTNTTWSADTVKVITNIRIKPGVKLTILPKTKVIFQGYWGIQVEDGSIDAVGTATDSITFTIFDTTSFYDINKSLGGWQGITFVSQTAGGTNHPQSHFSYCKFNFAKYSSAPYMYNGGRGDAITAIYYSNIDVSNCSFKHNNGASIMLEGCANISIINNEIINNNNYYNFSAVCASNSENITIEKNNISFNISKMPGGAISVLGSSNILNKITNNRICNNYAAGKGCGGSYGGGAIYLERNNNTFIGNNLIANNSALQSGGGIMCSSSSPTIINNTIVNNHADYLGGGITICDTWWGGSSLPLIQNNILYGNTHAEYYPPFTNFNLSKNQISFIGSTSGNITYSDVEGGSQNIKCLVVINNLSQYVPYTGTYNNNINSNPIFFSTSSASGNTFNGLTPDWRLQLSSPCINTASLSGLGILPSIDLWNNTRIVGSSIDMGAYEAPANSPDGINDYTNNLLISVFPNPTTNSFSVNYSLDYDKATISIVNALGQIVETKQFNGSEKMNFDVNSFAKGVYFINAIIDEKVISNKLIIK